MLDDYESSYHDLLKQCEVSGTKIITLRLLAIEVFKCVNKLDPKYLNEMFTIKKMSIRLSWYFYSGKGQIEYYKVRT